VIIQSENLNNIFVALKYKHNQKIEVPLNVDKVDNTDNYNEKIFTFLVEEN